MRNAFTVFFVVYCFVGCAAGEAVDAGDDDGDEGEAPTDNDNGDVDSALITQLAGLWTGPATSTTTLGDFPIMSMDLQDTDGSTLFARGDLDDRNAIRFALSIEPVAGVRTLVFRNGGLFQGFARDSRTALVSHDVDAGSWRFCDVGGGCDVVDATWTVQADELVLTATVHGTPHMRWAAERAEPRGLPAPYPRRDTAGGDFPPMATLTATVTFPALAADADVWLLLTSTPCGIAFDCTPSRSKRLAVAAGATSATVVIEQLHAGSWSANAILDRDRDMAQTFAPTSGDGAAALDTGVVIGGTADATVRLPIVFTVP